MSCHDYYKYDQNSVMIIMNMNKTVVVRTRGAGHHWSSSMWYICLFYFYISISYLFSFSIYFLLQYSACIRERFILYCYRSTLNILFLILSDWRNNVESSDEIYSLTISAALWDWLRGVFLGYPNVFSFTPLPFISSIFHPLNVTK